MFYWAAVMLLIALVAAAFGFGGIASSAVGFAKIIFFVAIVVALVSFALGFRRK